jgi:hypothetical protein
LRGARCLTYAVSRMKDLSVANSQSCGPRRLNESAVAVMQPDPNRIPRQVSLRDGGPEWGSIGRLREPRTARRWHRTQVRPRSAFDTAHDNAAASDTYRYSPMRCPRPRSGPAFARPTPRARDDRCSTVGNQGVSAPGQRRSRTACGRDTRAESCRSGVRRMDARAARTAPS